ncbi:MAG: 30S ribosomal protein S17 [Candidatus ainarchaeum sp.]|nr:30S ribosomal protein S17 [Candidatus ainarchaeum sp.]
MVEKKNKTEKVVTIQQKPVLKKKEYSVRGNVFEGIVTSAKASKTITVKREITHYISKYERYKKVFSKIKAHVPEGMIVKEGDKVRIGETRKISKTKNFILLEILNGEKK